jgi:hypothetical protein
MRSPTSLHESRAYGPEDIPKAHVPMGTCEDPARLEPESIRHYHCGCRGYGRSSKTQALLAPRGLGFTACLKTSGGGATVENILCRK